MDYEKAMQDINFTELYEICKQAVAEFNKNHTVETELKMLEAEKNYLVSELRYNGYAKILNNEDVSDVKSNIDKLELEFNNLKKSVIFQQTSQE